jgi:monovalent cation:H+ antiporter, CPA1 family
VLVCMFFIGVALQPFTEVGLLACLLLGAILATTDPVAVVALFREIGAPQRLSILLEGESLLNDAAAIALFTVLAAMLTGAGATGPTDAVLTFFKAFAGGLVLGALFGKIVSAALVMFRDHHVAETTFTVALAYLTFIIGEHYLHVSGVVAVVSAGLVLSNDGRRQLAPSRWEGLKVTWEQIGFWASSLIFLLAAMLAPRLLADVTWRDAGLLLVVVVAAFAARAITLFGLFPLLAAMGLGERVRTSHRLVVLWGGMRGAVSLALALAVTENAMLSPDVRQFIAVLATGFVLFTLLVNAPTLRYVMHLLGLDRLPAEELALRDRAIALSRAEIAESIGRLAHDRGLSAETAGHITGAYAGHSALGMDPDATLDAALRAYSGLGILVEREQETCLEYFENGTVSRRAIAELITLAERLHDGVKAGGPEGYLAAARDGLSFTLSFRAALELQRRLGITRLLAQALAHRLEMLIVHRLVLQDLVRFTGTKIRPLFGAATADQLRTSLEARMAEAERATKAIELQYPRYARTLEQQFLALSALRLEDESLHRLRGESIISQEMFRSLERDLRQRRDALERRPVLDLGLNRDELVARVAMFADLEPRERAEISRMLRPRLTVPDEVIVRKGERGDAMYFISSGAVEVRIAPSPVTLGTGDIFGEMALISGQPRMADVVSLGFGQLLSLSRRDFARLLKTSETLRAHIQAIARERRSGRPPAQQAAS